MKIVHIMGFHCTKKFHDSCMYVFTCNAPARTVPLPLHETDHTLAVSLILTPLVQLLPDHPSLQTHPVIGSHLLALIQLQLFWHSKPYWLKGQTRRINGKYSMHAWLRYVWDRSGTAILLQHSSYEALPAQSVPLNHWPTGQMHFMLPSITLHCPPLQSILHVIIAATERDIIMHTSSRTPFLLQQVGEMHMHE